MKRSPTSLRRRNAGFTLVELLVAVTISMALVLAITLMLVRSEAGRRALTSVNDVSSGGAYISFVLDRTLRSAGSGYIQASNTAFGCQLAVARGATQVLPRGSNFPAPFDGLPKTPRLIPVLVYAGVGAGSSDVIAVTSGSSGLGESPLRVLPLSVTGTGMRVPSTIGLRQKDLVLVIQDNNTCLMQQVKDGFTGSADQQLDFGGTYAATTVGTVSLTTAGAAGGNQAVVTPLGNVNGNRPNFSLIGVGPNSTLLSLDMLQLDGTDTPVPIADGVAEMRVLYGVDKVGNDGVIDTWVRPDAAPWDAATLQDGSTKSTERLGQILALRVGLILRNATPERDEVTGPSVSLFDDLPPLKQTRSLSSDERKLRWRVLDFTVPLRNVMLKPGTP
jgi:type IV pilus assembly protein PilW